MMNSKLMALHTVMFLACLALMLFIGAPWWAAVIFGFGMGYSRSGDLKKIAKTDDDGFHSK